MSESTGRWTVHRNAHGYADSIDCDGRCILHLQPGTLLNELNVDDVVARLNRALPSVLAAVELVDQCFRWFVSNKRELKTGPRGQGVGCESYRLDFTGYQESDVNDAIMTLKQRVYNMSGYPAEPSYEAWLDSLALGCECDDGPCAGCQQGGVCDCEATND